MAASPQAYEMEELPQADSLSLSDLQLSDLHTAGQVSGVCVNVHVIILAGKNGVNIFLPQTTFIFKFAWNPRAGSASKFNIMYHS